MPRCKWARVAAVVLFWHAVPLLDAAAEPHPHQAPPGQTGRPSPGFPGLPRHAKPIPLAKFLRLLQQGGIVLRTGHDREDQRAAAAAQMQADLETILAFQRDTGAEIPLPVESRDPTVTSLGPEDYAHRIRMRDGSSTGCCTASRWRRARTTWSPD